jgi:hypothetical protein
MARSPGAAAEQMLIDGVFCLRVPIPNTLGA